MELPPRPLKLKTAFVWRNQIGGILLLLAAVGVAAGYFAVMADGLKALWRESAIWKAGVEVREVSVSGERKTSKFIFHSYKLTVDFIDVNGARHSERVEFDTLLGTVNEDKPAVVRHLRADPKQFVLSWSQDVKLSRWLWEGFLLVAGVGLIGGTLVFMGWTMLRRLSDARHCAESSEQVALRFTEIQPEFTKGKHTANVFHYAGRTIDGRELAGKFEFPIKHVPLFTDAAQEAAVALVAAGRADRLVVLRGDFYPFVLEDHEKAAWLAALATNPPQS